MPTKPKRDPRNPDYGEHKVMGPNSMSLKCETEGCGETEVYVVDREPLDETDSVFISMGLIKVARSEGWKIHVQSILCPRCHMEHMISRDFIPERLVDDPDYDDLTDREFSKGA